jgi:hypothetical protein
MPAYARREIIAETEVGVYHCVSRCVRRAFLRGQDALTGRSFEHRKGWIQSRLEELAGIFAVDVLGFSVMSNHIHQLLRNRPDVAATWSDARHGKLLWPLVPSRGGSAAEHGGSRRTIGQALVPRASVQPNGLRLSKEFAGGPP